MSRSASAIPIQTMAAQPLVPLSTHIHPSPAYHRDFFVLRMPIMIDNQPSVVIKMVDATPVLHCPVVELSVQLVILAQHVSTVLADYHIALKGAYYDDNYPLYAIDLPPSISYEGLQSLLPAFSNVCYSITERYFSRIPCNIVISVKFELFLCSPAKDSFTASKVTLIQLRQESDEILSTFLRSKMFKFSELLSSSKAAAVSFKSLLQALSGKVSHKWFNFGALLGVSVEKLQTIEKQHQNPALCLTVTLKNVVDSNTELTWGEVVLTLSTVGLSNLAEEVSKEHDVCFLRDAENEPLTKPTLQSLNQSLAEVSAKWFNFGALLGVPPSTLQAIDNQYHSDCDDCLTRMLMWLIENSPITWSSVAQALSQIGYGDLAEQISRSHYISPVPSEGVPEQAEGRADGTEQWKTEAESSVTEIQQRVDFIQQDYDNMKHELKWLKEEKSGIEKRLEQEETQCSSLHESKRILTLRLKQKDQQHRQKLKAIEKNIFEKESTVADLKSCLDRTNMKYTEKSQRLASLAATQLLDTSKLLDNLFVLSKIEELFNERLLDYEKRLVEAKQVSQDAYLAEIKSQIETETKCVKSLEEEYHSVDKQCSDLAAIVDSIEGDITTKEQACDSLKKDTEVFVEQQIELTMLKMDVTNNKLEHAKAQIKCQVSTRKLACHKKEFQRAKNLLPELSMCSVDSIDISEHKARAYVGMEIKVHLYDRDGEPCRGQHLVTLCCEKNEQIFTEVKRVKSSAPGTYFLFYTPSCLGKHSLVVAVNNTPIDKRLEMFILNSPHPPNCTITVSEKEIIQDKKFDALVQLRDKNGSPINSQQKVSAYLKFHVSATIDKGIGERICKPIISWTAHFPYKYMLALTPPSSGEGMLSVFVDDQLVACRRIITGSKSSSVLQDKMFKMLLIGEIGSGKTSFLNLLYNYATLQALGSGFGADGLEQFQQLNIQNEKDATDDATLYTVAVGDLKVGIIDTPGLCDSRGLEQGINALRIIDALNREEYINCICLIINGRQASASLKYVLSEITAILPRHILDNVIVVFSNTADPLDLTFNLDTLKDNFGKEFENIFFVENPCCLFEKAKAKMDQLGIKRVAKSLQKAYKDTSEVLTEMCDAIKDFPEVHTHHFIELFEKKKTIETNVARLLTIYDIQTGLEKSLKDAKGEIDAAVTIKSYYENTNNHKTQFEKANSDEERARLLYGELLNKWRNSESDRKQLSSKLSNDIIEFETLGVAHNYSKLIENQLAMIKSHLEGPDKDDICIIKDELVKRLKIIQAAKSGSMDYIVTCVPPSHPHLTHPLPPSHV